MLWILAKGMLRKVIALLGLATILFVIANVHFGMVAENVVEGAGTARLDVLRIAAPGCTIPEMEKGNRYCILLGREGDMWDSRYSPFVLGHSYRNCRALPYALRPSIGKAYSASYVYFRSSSVWSSNLGPISMAANISKFRKHGRHHPNTAPAMVGSDSLCNHRSLAYAWSEIRSI